MTFIRTTLTIAVLTGALASTAFAADEVLIKDRADENYCHMKFPAISDDSLATKNPSLESPATGDIIDYYGSCDETPTSASQVLDQKHEETFMFGREYEDGE